MYAIGAEDAELARIEASEVEKPSTLTRARQRYLVVGAAAAMIFIFDQHFGLRRQRFRQAQIGKRDDLRRNRGGAGNGGTIGKLHSLIETE
jgi:hypothetical protein